jgi:pimeloyl-ACP methyl ester carboxylesterase
MLILVLSVWFATSSAWAQDERGAEAWSEFLPGRFNLPLRTAGGLQCWGDEVVCSGARIQRNAITGHCRLLDGDDRRQAWGTLEECRAALDVLQKRGVVAPIRGRVVLVLHGLAGARPLMSSLCRHLDDEGKLQVVSICYPSTREDIDADAAALQRIISGLREAQQIDLVAHSLGCIVIRRCLAMQEAADGKQDPRIRRFVMLTPPNHGAPDAAPLVEVDFTGKIAGPAAHQLTAGFAELEPKLATPACEFGILAGGRGEPTGYNPLIPGDNDGVVPLNSAKLVGARDFRLLPVLHVTYPRNEQVKKLTLKFLQEGYFETAETRNPL